MEGDGLDVVSQSDENKSLSEKSWEGGRGRTKAWERLMRKEVQSLEQFVLVHLLRNSSICSNSEPALNWKQVSSLNGLYTGFLVQHHGAWDKRYYFFISYMRGDRVGGGEC